MARPSDLSLVVAGAGLVVAAIALFAMLRAGPPGTPLAPATEPQPLAIAALAAANERSMAFLPAVAAPDFPFDTPGLDFISRDVGRAMAQEMGVRVADEAATEAYRGWQGEPVVAAAALGVRFVFVARLSGDETDARIDVAVTDARTGAIAFEGPFYIDRENVALVPLEIATALVLAVLNRLPSLALP